MAANRQSIEKPMRDILDANLKTIRITLRDISTVRTFGYFNCLQKLRYVTPVNPATFFLLRL